MKKINLKAMNNEEVVTVYLEAQKILNKEREQAKNEFIKDSKEEWVETGTKFKLQREYLSITLKRMSQIIGCSASKLRKFENGEPIMAAEMLQRSYSMALQLEHIKQEKERLKTKDISNPDTLTYEETKNFYEILWMWIGLNDLSYSLQEFVDENLDEVLDDTYGRSFAELLEKHEGEYDVCKLAQ